VADGEAVGHVKTVDVETDDVAVKMFAQIRGISTDTAKKILEIKDINSWMWLALDDHAKMRENLKRVDGVGNTLAQRVINAFQ